jgi:hypothetical protein
MQTGFAFVQRLQEDAEFRKKVNAYPNRAKRLAFLKSDCTPYVQIYDNLSSGQWPTGGLPRPGGRACPRPGAPGLWNRISQICRGREAPRPDR